VLAITLVPVLMILFIRGRPAPRIPGILFLALTQAIYLPVLRLCLRFRKTTLILNLIFLVVTLPLALKIGSQFMPPLFEVPLCICRLLCLESPSDKRLSYYRSKTESFVRFPEVETVFGTIGRSDSATDNAPLDMYDTTIMLKPRTQWRRE